ncbi:protein of unknown function (DUF303) [Pontibacter ummariensis]|uniref:Sialate O-acetylesterase domain-containing protein n=1 Tax=Pontibacter ummariensis TaxID=1610492 RepID=A0A239DN71_9BACT|nr:sialate O-acetylesterase [Pontibacter ummariensis]PRY13850.1 protein of unknown function (DUF303) [Pontibacter ummariensis]SNS33609.1 hypothetical protein SAMN06296052_10532 [Pontibacter ummariensis]
MERAFSILLLLLTCAFVASCGKEEPDLPEGEPVDVHIIIGQSNSIGRAAIYQLPPEYHKPLEGCYIFNRANEQFELILTGVNTQSEKGQFGPVVQAAKLLREYKGQNVYFIVAGVGGSQLYKSGTQELLDWHPDSEELILQTKQTIEEARATLLAQGKAPQFKSIAWWQGEHDSFNEAKALAYQENETALFKAFDQVPYLSKAKRVVYKIFSDADILPHAATINAAKAKRAASDPRTVAVIETDGYTRIPNDRIHATDTGQLQAGRDLFNAIKDL